MDVPVRQDDVMPFGIFRKMRSSLHVRTALIALLAAVLVTALNVTEGNRFYAFSAGLAVAAVAYLCISLWLRHRIRGLAGAAARAAEGDLSVRAPVRGTHELASLAASLNTLIDRLQNHGDEAAGLPAGRISELQTLYEVAFILSQSLELKAVLPKILNHVISSLGDHKGVIALADRDGAALAVLAQEGLLDESIEHIVQRGDGCVGDVILRNRSIMAAIGDEDGPSELPGLEREGILSVLAVPLTARGAALGCMAVYSSRAGRFAEHDEALLSAIGSQIGVAIENARLYERTLEMAREDGLTRLANRRHLMDVLKHEVMRSSRYGSALSALILDLDKFKRFNDSYGHLKGDDLLRGFSALIKQNIRATDLAGRYGGEEFTVVLPNTPLAGASIVAERIRQATERFTIALDDGARAGTTVSIGAAEFVSGQSEEQLLASADAALYRAKEGGRNRVAW